MISLLVVGVVLAGELWVSGYRTAPAAMPPMKTRWKDR